MYGGGFSQFGQQPPIVDPSQMMGGFMQQPQMMEPMGGMPGGFGYQGMPMMMPQFQAPQQAPVRVAYQT